MSAFSVATANTYKGQMLLHPNGLEPFSKAKVDILLLQEVFGLGRTTIEDSLKSGGFRAVNIHETSGLVVAVRKDTEINVDKGHERYDPLIWRSRAGSLVHGSRHATVSRLRQRGLISVQLTTADGSKFIVATTHISVFIRRHARARQLMSIEKLLRENHDTELPLILGADMNHYPRAGKKDFGLHAAAQFKVVAIEEPTWRVRDTKHEWLARIGALATGRPLDSFDAHLDALLYRGEGLSLAGAEVVNIESDHSAIIGRFVL